MKVKIKLNPEESVDEAEDLLLKALINKRENSHSDEFSDPKLNALCRDLEKKHNEVIDRALKEILEVIGSK